MCTVCQMPASASRDCQHCIRRMPAPKSQANLLELVVGAYNLQPLQLDLGYNNFLLLLLLYILDGVGYRSWHSRSTAEACPW